MSVNLRLCNLEKKLANLEPSDNTKSDDTSEELKKLVADLTGKVSTLESKLEEANKKIQSNSETSNSNTQKLMQVIQPLQTSLTSVEKRVAKLE
tara:strand:- start:10026 stop:10307 length:282 start_codon:yes stop_codon:yes gene_type:complete